MNPRTTYYLFVALSALGMSCHATAYAPFLRSIGLSLSDIALVNVIFWIAVIVAELPTGLVADGRGRGWSLKIGAVVLVIGELAYFAAQGFWGAVLGEVVIALGLAFFSGAQQAWITDALIHRGEKEDIGKVFATSAAVRGAAALLGGVFGALIASWSLRVPWLLEAGFSLYLAIILQVRLRDEGEPLERITEFEAFRRSWALLRKQYALKWGIAAAVILGLVVPFNHYWTLYFHERVGQNSLGLIWVVIYLSVVVAGLLVRRLKINQGYETFWIIGALFLAGLGLVLMGLHYGLWLPLVFAMVHEVGRGAFEPLLDSFTQHRVESSYRATYGSLQSLLGRSGFGLALIGVWWITHGKSNSLPTIQDTFLICGTALSVLALVLWLFRPNGKE